MSGGNVIALDMDDDLERLLDQACANASMACGDGDFEKLAHYQFREDMSRLEDILRYKGVLPHTRECDTEIEE